MTETPKIVAQISSIHSSDDALSPRRVATHIDRIAQEIPIDIIAVGWQERPDLYRMLTSPESRPCPEVFLWYAVLSDYPGFDPSHLVVDSTFARSRGWRGYADLGISEGFKQSCPNNPDTVSATLGYLDDCMARYPFDGVFLDKIRFPSPANGLQEVFSCFCPHCAEKAAGVGLDLDEVRHVLNRTIVASSRPELFAIPGGSPWLDAVLAEQPLLRRFIRFRADSVTELVATAARRMRAMGKKVSLDVFSPTLAPLVGQDFAALAQHADWAKPMIYRFTQGPSSLRDELPSLIRELGAYLNRSEADAMQWAAAHVRGLEGQTIETISERAPLSLIRAETDQALSLFAPTPLYLGLETVSIEGLMSVTPRNVEEILEIGTLAGVHGYVLSWDLLNTPVENVKPLSRLRRHS